MQARSVLGWIALLLVASPAAATEMVAPSFDERVVDVAGPRSPWAKSFADINGDGLIDLIVGGHEWRQPSLLDRILRKVGLASEPGGGGELVWYENPEWTRHLITTSYAVRTDLDTADLDQDGDQDLVLTTDQGLVWLRNPEWSSELIDDRKLHDVIAIDLDGDGWPELVARNQRFGGYEDGDSVFIYAREPPAKWRKHAVAVNQGEGLAVTDIDGDGLPDILVNGLWLRNPGRPDGAWTATNFAREWTWPDVVIASADFNLDGRPDIAMAPSEPEGGRYRVSWFEAPAERSQRWVEHVLDADVETVLHSLAAEDVNCDGRVDLLTAEMNQSADPDDVRVYLNGAGAPWVVSLLGGGGLHNLQAFDFDSDFDTDFFGANWQIPGETEYPVRLWVNRCADPPEWRRVVIDDSLPWPALGVWSVDLGDVAGPAVVAGGSIYRQTGSPVRDWERMELGSGAYNVVLVADFDDDSDADLLISGWRGYDYQPGLLARILNRTGWRPHDYETTGAELVWGKNDGDGAFQILPSIPTGAGDFLQGSALVSGDESPQVLLSWHSAGSPLEKIKVPESLDLQASLEPLGSESQNESLASGDIDGDGDEDVLLGTRWLEQLEGGAWRSHWIERGDRNPDRSLLFDWSGDGRLDALVGFEAIGQQGPLAWYEQSERSKDPWIRHHIAELIGPMSLDIGDVDGDGDFDIAVGEHDPLRPRSARLLWFENLRGSPIGGPGDWRAHLIHRGDEHHQGVRMADVDEDGDLDVLSIGWTHSKLLLYLNPRVP
ncbi:MAG: VCBS repeat-containing protein [Roseibium album]|uniref:FG-GAP repeat domain-containing protein n=1 Tax=Roseibium album TaxID=311410 RepID=UPI0032EBFA2E